MVENINDLLYNYTEYLYVNANRCAFGAGDIFSGGTAMENRKMPEAEKIATQKRGYRIWQRVVSLLACVVVLCTTYAMILPAITMEKAAVCGMEEHSHTEECYDGADLSVLICALEEHTHSDECRRAEETTLSPEETTPQAVEENQVTELVEDLVISGEGEAPEAISGPLPENEHIPKTEISGTNLTWRITVNSLNEYTMWIEGEGAMANYGSADEQPWKEHRSKVSKVKIGERVTRIGNFAFEYITIKELTWGGTDENGDLVCGVKEIGYRAFSQCGMASLTIPDTVTSIENQAFTNNTLTNGLVLGNGIQTIGDNAFNNANTEVYIPASVTSIGKTAFHSAKAFTVQEDNPN